VTSDAPTRRARLGDSSLPLVLLDVDGVIVDTRALRGEERPWQMDEVETTRFPVPIPVFMPALIQALHEVTEIWWCTTWGERANHEIGRFLGIPQLPVVWRDPDPALEDWKVAGARPLARAALAAGRRVVWIEDFDGYPPERAMPAGTEFVDTSADGTCVLLPRFLPGDLWLPIDWLDLPAEWMGTPTGRGTAGTVRGDVRDRPCRRSMRKDR
jgi:hypothetical protein